MMMIQMKNDNDNGLKLTALNNLKKNECDGKMKLMKHELNRSV